MNSAGSKVRPSLSPGPETLTRLASPISDWLIMTVMGLLGMCRPFFLMLTMCSPISLGTKEIPAKRKGGKSYHILVSFPTCRLPVGTKKAFFPTHQHVHCAGVWASKVLHDQKVGSQWRSAGSGLSQWCSRVCQQKSPLWDGTCALCHLLQKERSILFRILLSALSEHRPPT